MPNDSPAVILYDGYGNPVTIDGYHVSVYPKGLGIGGHYPDPSLTYPDVSAGEKAPFIIDEHGGLTTRGQVFTDEGSYYFDFNSALDSDWTTSTNDASIAVSASNLIISLGTGADGYATITRPGHCLPAIIEFDWRVIGRKNSQSIKIGFTTEHGGFAYVEYQGTENSLATFASSCVGSVGTIETTDFVFPNGYRSINFLHMKIEIGFGYTACIMEGKTMAFHVKHIPEVYHNLDVYIDARNEDAKTSNTYVYIDTIRLINHNVVQIAGNYTANPINVDLKENTEIILKGPGATDDGINVEHEGNSISRLFTSDAENSSTLEQILVTLKKIETHLSEMNEFNIDTGDIDE